MVNRSMLKQTRKVRVVNFAEDGSIIATSRRDNTRLNFTFDPGTQEAPEVGSTVTIENEGQGWVLSYSQH